MKSASHHPNNREKFFSIFQAKSNYHLDVKFCHKREDFAKICAIIFYRVHVEFSSLSLLLLKSQESCDKMNGHFFGFIRDVGNNLVDASVPKNEPTF